MVINLKVSSEREREGICPSCKEWTTAGDSCCGDGAYVEGGLVSDQAAIEDAECPTTAVYLKRDKPYSECKTLHSALWAAGLHPMLFGNGPDDGPDSKWNVVIHVELSALSKQE